MYILNARLQDYIAQTFIFSKPLCKLCQRNCSHAKLKYVVQNFMLFPMIYRKLGHKLANVKTARINKVLIAFVHRITMRKHLYSVGVYEKSVFPVVPKLEYIMQYFMLFPTIYSRLVHKFINVKTARINKLLIAFVHRITLRKHLIQQAFMQNLFAQLFPNSTILCSISRSFQRCTVNWGTSSQTSKSEGLISANYFFCIY